MRPPVRVTPPAVSPVALETMKVHLRVGALDGDGNMLPSEDDALIQAYTEAATAYLDGYSGVLGRCLIDQEWRQDFDGFCRPPRLPLPASSVTSITYRNAAGQISTVAQADYALDHDATGSFVRFGRGYAFPSDLYETGAVSVTFVSGYGPAPEDVPAPLRSAIMLMVGDLYAHRETASERGSGIIDMSLPVTSLIAPYRRWSI